MEQYVLHRRKSSVDFPLNIDPIIISMVAIS
jgi:hypothetical protein